MGTIKNSYPLTWIETHIFPGGANLYHKSHLKAGLGFPGVQRSLEEARSYELCMYKNINFANLKVEPADKLPNLVYTCPQSLRSCVEIPLSYAQTPDL